MVVMLGTLLCALPAAQTGAAIGVRLRRGGCGTGMATVGVWPARGVAGGWAGCGHV